MSALGIRVATGPETAKIASDNRAAIARRDEWPFPWVYPPPDSIRRNPMGTAATAAPAASALVLTFTVPQGFKFELTGILAGVYSANMQPVGNPGDYLFSVTRDQPFTGNAPQGNTLADLYQIPFYLGSPSNGPFPLPRSETFAPNNAIRVICTTVNGGGVPNFACAMLAGWLRKA